MTETNVPPQSIQVLDASRLRVVDGANLGDTLSFADELMLDDVYQLDGAARMMRLSVLTRADGQRQIGPGSDAGHPGATVHLDCAITLMSPDGVTKDAIVLVELDSNALIAAIYLLPLVPLQAQQDYRLVRVDRAAAARRFAEVACVSFTRGTHITLATGAQIPIEELRVGDKVLTRDEGPQAVRWIGQTTVRGTGAFAPICISAGTLNNSHDLLVSPDHRLFIYQRSDQIGAGSSAILVKARHLVNGDTVTVQHGGFVDYFQLLFDQHQIIYAEGIAAETLLLDQRTRPALAEEMAVKLGDDPLPGHRRGVQAGVDVSRSLLDRPDAAELLRRASQR